MVHIFGSKGKARSTVKPTVSPPSRLPVRKRDHQQVASDEDDSAQPHPRAHVRQRVSSVSSVASVETIRPKTPTGPTFSRPKPTRVVSRPSTPTGPTVSRPKTPTAPPRPKTPTGPTPLSSKPARKGSKSFTPKNKAISSNSVAFPSEPDLINDEDLLSEDDEGDTNGLSLSQQSTGTRRRVLTRTVSYRALPGFGKKRKTATASPAPPTVPPLSEEDEKIIQAVVNSLACDEDPFEDEDDEEFNRLFAEASARKGVNPFCTPAILNEHNDDVPPPSHVPRSVEEQIYASVASKQRFGIDILPHEHHIVVWDSDEGYFVWSAMLIITDYSPRHDEPSFYPPIKGLHIDCRSVRLGENKCAEDLSETCPSAEYFVQYTGQNLPQSQMAARFKPWDGICIEPTVHPRSPAAPGRAAEWAIEFWVPVSMHLFSRCEYKPFRLRASLDFWDWQARKMTVHSGVVQVTMEHLRRDKHMVVVRH